MFFKIKVKFKLPFQKKPRILQFFHLHFDVKSVIDSFPILLYEKLDTMAIKLSGRSIDTQNQENFVVQPWHEFFVKL